jgi:hypothetical protein
MSTSTTSTSESVLEHPYTYFTWFAKIKGSVPRDLWKYFDPEQQDELEQPEPVTIDQVREGANTLHELTAPEKTIFSQLRSIYTQELTQFYRLLSEEAKLREKIMSSVSESKKSQLRAEE